MRAQEVAGLVRRWWWFLILGPLLAGAVAHEWSVRHPAGYVGTAMLLVNALGEPGTLGPDAPRGGEELARSYQELVVTWPVLTEVIRDLELEMDVDQLRDRVEAEAISGTQLLRITAWDSQPQAAADLANSVAENFGTYMVGQQAERIRTVDAEIASTIDETQTRIAEIEQDVGELEAAADATSAENQERIASLRAELDSQQANLAYWQERRREIAYSAAAAADHVAVVATAQPPRRQSSPDPLLSLLIGAAAGLLVVVGALILREFTGGEARARTPASASARAARLPLDQPL
jgi:capsular polysaccharide biosynthesis protein